MKRIHTGMIAAALLAFVLSAAGCAPADSSSSKNAVSSKPAESSAVRNDESSKTDESSKVEESSKADEKPVPEQKDAYYVGDVWESDELKITYVSSGVYDYPEDAFFQPNPDKNYITVTFLVENIYAGSQAAYGHKVYVSGTHFECYGDEEECTTPYDSGSFSSIRLEIGKHVTATLVYAVPNDAKEVFVQYNKGIDDVPVKFMYGGVQDSGTAPDKDTTIPEDAVSVGGTVETSEYRIKYLSFGDCTGNSLHHQPAEGYRLVYCEFEVENIADVDRYISDTVYFVCSADGEECESNISREDGLGSTLKPGEKVIGTATFEVPENAEVVLVTFKDHPDSGPLVLYTFVAGV